MLLPAEGSYAAFCCPVKDPMHLLMGLLKKHTNTMDLTSLLGRKTSSTGIQILWKNRAVSSPKYTDYAITCLIPRGRKWFGARTPFKESSQRKNILPRKTFFPYCPTDQLQTTIVSRIKVLRSNGRGCFHPPLSPVRITAPDPQRSYWSICMIE